MDHEIDETYVLLQRVANDDVWGVPDHWEREEGRGEEGAWKAVAAPDVLQGARCGVCSRRVARRVVEFWH